MPLSVIDALVIAVMALAKTMQRRIVTNSPAPASERQRLSAAACTHRRSLSAYEQKVLRQPFQRRLLPR